MEEVHEGRRQSFVQHHRLGIFNPQTTAFFFFFFLKCTHSTRNNSGNNGKFGY